MREFCGVWDWLSDFGKSVKMKQSVWETKKTKEKERNKTSDENENGNERMGNFHTCHDIYSWVQIQTEMFTEDSDKNFCSQKVFNSLFLKHACCMQICVPDNQILTQKLKLTKYMGF